MTNKIKWVKIPGPGQYRGQGEWEPFQGSDAEWDYLRTTLYLPTHEGEKPEDND